MSRRTKLVGIVLAMVLIPMMGQACPPADVGMPGAQGVPGIMGDPGVAGPAGPPGASPFTLVGSDAVLNGVVFADAFSSNSPLLLQTAGTTRIFVDDVTGNVGIGTASPDSKLHVGGLDDAIIGPIVHLEGDVGFDQFESGRVRFTEKGGQFIGGYLHYDGAANLFHVGVHNVNNTNPADDTNAITIDRMNGNVGIGTASPGFKLHVRGGSDASAAGGGFAVFGSATAGNIAIDLNEIMARNNGAISNLAINAEGGDVKISQLNTDTNGGKLAIRTATPVTTVHINHSNDFNTNGLTIEGEDDFRWNIYHASTEELWLVFEDSQVGEFNENTGVYSAVSDRRLKKNIEPVGAVLPRIMQLKPSKYQFNEEADSDPKHFGLIAQDLINVFPEVVTVHDNNAEDGGIEGLHLVAYSELVPILTRGIQEQQEIIDRHETTIADLTARLERLEAAMGN